MTPTRFSHAPDLILSDAPIVPAKRSRTPLWVIIREAAVMWVWALIAGVALWGMG